MKTAGAMGKILIYALIIAFFANFLMDWAGQNNLSIVPITGIVALSVSYLIYAFIFAKSKVSTKLIIKIALYVALCFGAALLSNAVNFNWGTNKTAYIVFTAAVPFVVIELI